MGKALEAGKQAYAAFGAGNIPALLDLLADDVEWRFLPKPEYGTPYGGTYRGKAEVGQFFGKLAQAVEMQVFEPREFFEGPDHLATVGRARARVLPDGQVHETEWMHIAVINDGGKIARWFGTEDSAARWNK